MRCDMQQHELWLLIKKVTAGKSSLLTTTRNTTVRYYTYTPTFLVHSANKCISNVMSKS
jgi:hypothetical protein